MKEGEAAVERIMPSVSYAVVAAVLLAGCCTEAFLNMPGQSTQRGAVRVYGRIKKGTMKKEVAGMSKPKKDSGFEGMGNTVGGEDGASNDGMGSAPKAKKPLGTALGVSEEEAAVIEAQAYEVMGNKDGLLQATAATRGPAPGFDERSRCSDPLTQEKVFLPKVFHDRRTESVLKI